ncbi:MAG: peptidase, M16 family protein [Algoriphagus sp. 32-45-6]|nr:MAG: peptidase, M16 family protein [Algoriphagus sp. 32-45-6]
MNKIKSLFLSALLLGAVQGQLIANTPLVKRKIEIKVEENDPQTIIQNYVKAVGGKEKITAIKNTTMTGEASFMGQSITIKTVADSENERLLQSTSVGGNVMQQTVLMNGKAQVMAMGQVQELPDEMTQLLKTQTYAFPEMNYESLGFELEYVGEEDLDGEKVHKLQIKAPNGMVTNEYYSVASSLKVRTSSEATGDISYSDYQEVDGVLFPMTLTIKNAMLPEALVTKMTSVKFNQTLTDADFN